MEDDLIDFFSHPNNQRQKQYEAVRAIIIDHKTAEETANKFGYKTSTVYSLLRDAKAGRLELFPIVKMGPKKKRTPIEIQQKIITYRKQNLSSPNIEQRLSDEGSRVSIRTIERILKEAGLQKLQRRTFAELGKAVSNKILPERSEQLNLTDLEPFNVDCPSVGVFFFLPYIKESGILKILKSCKLPESSDIEAEQACLSMLILKLIGRHRLSHIGTYDQEPGLGVFAGLNILPKPTYMNTYSCRCSEAQLMKLQNKIITAFKKKYPDFYRSDYINLDFHSIPHYGDTSKLEKVWCGARVKTMKGATTVFAQDSQSNAVIYTRADILRKEEATEVKKFVDFWKKIKGNVDETLVFDCKFTTYQVLDDLEDDNIKFITLRKRSATLIEKTLEIPKVKWEKIYVSIPKRKYKRVSVHETPIKFKNCHNIFRQIAIKDHGRSKPTFIITNDKTLSLKTILEVYARRWRIENKLSELVAFFNLNALSSPIMTRIHFDILWTMVSDTLYHRFAQDLRRFENASASQLFRKFIDMPGRVIYDGKNFKIKIRKRAHTPILKDVKKIQKPIKIPWLNNRTIEIIWTA